MVAKLFRPMPPNAESKVLDPGCGPGAFIDGVLRWCESHSCPIPQIVGIESDPLHFGSASQKYANLPQVCIRRSDFLTEACEKFDYIVGNPPYVSILGLSECERKTYKRLYTTATNRFDLYILFFERAVKSLTRNGRLVFITPEKYVFVDSAAAIRMLLRQYSVDELHYVNEAAFGNLVTYPLITTINFSSDCCGTRIIHRNGRIDHVELQRNSESWLPRILGSLEAFIGPTLSDVSSRISCGIATGADDVFVVRTDDLDPGLRKFAYPTIAGRDIQNGQIAQSLNSILVPYDECGRLYSEADLGQLGDYLSLPENRSRLITRTCVKSKPWYSFHENPPMRDLLSTKVLCKDICSSPFFVQSSRSALIPRHSVYYIVPRASVDIDQLNDYLNSPTAQEWLHNHCQRASKGYLRLQSNVLRQLPIPRSLLLKGSDLSHKSRQLALTI